MSTLALGLLSVSAESAIPSHFVTGFNQGWFDTRKEATFGCSWLRQNPAMEFDPAIGNCYDPNLAEEILSATREFGGSVLRMWLFESPENLNWIRDPEDGQIFLHPSVVPNVRDFMQRAKVNGVQVYWTLFADKLPRGLRLGPLKKKGGDHAYSLTEFLTQAVKPLLPVFTEFAESVYAIDVYNEIDGAVLRGYFDWEEANALTCTTRQFLRDHLKPSLPVTASLGWPWDPFHFYSGAIRMVGKQPRAECVDFYDFHHYDRFVAFQNCEDLQRLARSKPVVLGEFGMTGKLPWIREPSFPDQDDASGSFRVKNVQRFMTEAKRCGLSGALAWRLKEIDREGRAIRNSYMGTGKARYYGEAWDVAMFRWLSQLLSPVISSSRP